MYDLEAFQVGDRQYRSAIIARAYYVSTIDSTPEWRRQVAEISQQRAGLLEPPIMELLVSWTYRLINREHLWIPGFLSSLFWVIGGTFLYKILQRSQSMAAALLATAYYLFVPMGVHISTGFVPDPLMIMLFLLSILMILRYYDEPSSSRLILAGAVSALAVLVKPFCLLAIIAAFLSLSISQKTSWKSIIEPNFLIFLGFILLPALYYIYNIYTGGSLTKQAQNSFLPQLWLTRSYWLDWLKTASGVVGLAPLISALIGFSIVRKGRLSALLVGLWASYAIFCLVFAYHIRFGPHYHSQLIIVVAISISPIIALIANQLNQLPDKWLRQLSIIAAMLIIALINFREIRHQITSAPTLNSKEIYQKIGEIVGHSTNTVYLAPYYGTPLEYYGELSGTYWPRGISDSDAALGLNRTRSVEERLDTLDFIPEYFIITNMVEYETYHANLKEYLERHCSQFINNEAYQIYGQCLR